MSEYKNRNLLIEEENAYIIFNVPTSRIFSVDKDISNINDVLEQINKICYKVLQPKEIPTIEKYHSLVISCAETCNLRCKYCFANAGTYNSQNNKIMNDEDYSVLLNKIMSLNYPLLSICFFGGEPLLGFRSIKKFVKDIVERYKLKNWDVPEFGMVSNGTLINKEVVDFLNEYNVSVSISLDGPKELNDKSRYYENKEYSVYDTVKENMKYMKEHTFMLSVIATISRERIRNHREGDFKNLIQHFLGMGFDNAECLIADEREPLTDLDRSNIMSFAREQVNYLFDEIEKGRILNFLPRVPFGAVSAIVKKKYISECPAGKHLIYYTANGEIYPCQLYYAKKEKKANLLSRTKNDFCKKCFCVNICSGFCPGSSVLYNGTENSVVETRCLLQKTLVEETIKKLNIYFNSNLYKKEEQEVFIDNIIRLSKQYNNR